MRPKIQFYTIIAILFITTILRSQPYYIDNFDVTIDIKEDGSFNVTEDIEVWFLEERRGIIRDIPTRYDFLDNEFSIEISNIDVPDWQFMVNRSRNGTSIRIGNPDVYITGNKNYRISYTVNNAILTLPDHTEFYWNITGHKNDTRIENATFKIRLPKALDMAPTDYKVFTGREGERGEDATISHAGKEISGMSLKILDPGEGVTVAINLPKDYIIPIASNTSLNEDGSRVRESGERSGEGALPLIPAFLFAFLIRAYNKYGINKNRKVKEEIPEEYYAPEGMNSAEVGTFYDFTVHNSDLVSLIPKWGNEGYVEVRSIPDHDGNPKLYFYKIKDLPEDVSSYEKTFFEGLFKDADQVFISDLKDKFYTVMASTRKELSDEVKDLRLYDPAAMQYFKRWYVIVGLILSIIAGILIMAIKQWFISGAIMIAIGIALFVFIIRRPKLTEEGVLLHEKLIGFYKFLKDPNPKILDKLLEKDPKYLESVFPYVVAFGLDRSWSDRINTYNPDYIPPPWYYSQNSDGSRNTSTSWSDFGSSFDVKSITSVFSSAPSSSGGSGSSFSGGSSGGGFGGGGTSSW